jgi:hypothetical protein
MSRKDVLALLAIVVFALSVRPSSTHAASVSFKAPVSGATVSGTLGGAACEASAGGANRVEFFLDDTALNVDAAAPWNCVLDTRQFADGGHALRAVAYDKRGRASTGQVSITISNAAPPPPPPPPPSSASAVPTFESLGLYWKPPSNPGSAGCSVQYRRTGEATWRDGLALWYDARNAECRGSLVHLNPGTSYDVRLSLADGASTQLTASTWAENFPVARTVVVPSGTTTLQITQGGTASGYVLYTAAPEGTVLDAGNAAAYNVTISAPYVIVRGLTLRGAQQDAIRLLAGARDVVIEANDISGWGRQRDGALGVDLDSGVRAVCSDASLQRVVIQRNRIHHPRYGANSWSSGHPQGPQGITFNNCAGNHVIRYNEITSEEGRYFNDGMGGSANFSTAGFPNADSDIYGNIVTHAWDDAIEAEGGNRNVRIWGNYMDRTAVGVASTLTATGPVYLFRNVQNRSRHFSHVPPDSDQRNVFSKSGSTSLGGGRRYVLHNTLLQATEPGSIYGLGAGHAIGGTGSTQPVTNTVSRNNIFQIWKSSDTEFYQLGSGNDFGYDLYNGSLNGATETNGIPGLPIYAAGNGWTSEAGGLYALATDSPGYDAGQRIANFNDAFAGAAPDVGAHEAGAPAMRLGTGTVSAPAPSPSPPPAGSSTPYFGTPISIPATIEAENFDKGGEGIAYHDNVAGNAGGQYRTSEDVDIIVSSDPAGGGYVVNNFETGEWMHYTIRVPTAGNYNLELRVSSRFTTGAFHVEVDGVDVTGRIAVPNTGNWSAFQWITAKAALPLSAGDHVLKVVADQQYFNLNSVRLAP